MKINESGRSMIEMLGVLAIVGVLSVGGIAGYSRAMSKFRENKTVDMVSHIAANTRILYGSQKSYKGLNDSIAEKAKLFPEGNNANPFGGSNPVSIKSATRGTAIAENAEDTSGDEKAFVIVVPDVPVESCINLLTIDWGTGTGGGIIAIGTDEDGVTLGLQGCTPGATDTGYACGVMTVDQAVAACDDGGSDLYFKFY